MMAQGGKALDIETPIATPTGWSKMGDLQAGDKVFDESGKICTVTLTTPVMRGHDCYTVRFSDGASITADADHRWYVEPDYPVAGKSSDILTTAEIAKNYRRGPTGNRTRYAIPRAKPLALPGADLPINPYLLGAWLGDGSSNAAQISVGAQDVNETAEILSRIDCNFVIKRDKSAFLIQYLRSIALNDECIRGHQKSPGNTNAAGYCAECARQHAKTHQYPHLGNRLDPIVNRALSAKLNDAGLINNKHIPPQYLRASFQQRLALLQGLMDTDGSVDKRGRSEFVTTSPALADGFAELLSTFGIKSNSRRKHPKTTYKGKSVTGTDAWVFAFIVYDDLPIFRLARKLARLPSRAGRRTTETKRRRIVCVEKVESVPVRCISVDSPSHLYLAGRDLIPTHNTQGFFNVIGQRLDDNPVPILFIGPSKSNITGVIEPKVDQMLRSSESLWTKTSKGKKYSIYKKVVSGVILRFAWAGSTTEIKSDSACIVIVDEIDETEHDINGQGDIVSLADARHSAYPDGITIGASTPTIGTVNTYTHPITGFEHWEVSDDVESLIWRYWQGGTRHEWAWPCPECDEYFIPRLKLLWWPSKSTPLQAERDARLVCPKCGSQIETKHKTEMNARGVYVAPGQWVTPDGEVQGDAPESSDATYWVSGLANFSSKKTFGFLAHAFLKVARSGDPDAVKGVLNAEFGECFKVRGDAPEWEVVRDLGTRSHYLLGQVPSGTVTLVAGVDVQKNRLVYVVRGFGEAYGSALIERGELWGETDLPDVWLQLSKLLTDEWDGLTISKMAVDSGYRPEPVYDFCRRHRAAFPTKGHDHLDKPYYAKLIDCNIRGRLVKNGVQLWHFDSDSFKSWVHSRIEWPEDQPGGWQLPVDIDEDYCKQIVAEQRVQKPSGGVIWIQTSKDNHFLDCEALAYLAIRINGIVKKQTAERLQKNRPPPQQQQGHFARNGL